MAKLAIRVTGLALAAAAAVLGWGMAGAHAQAPGPSGEAIFAARCKMCHDPAVDPAPSVADLAQRPAGDIQKALTTGVMASMAEGLNAAEIDAVAAYIAAAGQPAAPPPPAPAA